MPASPSPHDVLRQHGLYDLADWAENPGIAPAYGVLGLGPVSTRHARVRRVAMSRRARVPARARAALRRRTGGVPLRTGGICGHILCLVPS